MSYAPRSGRIIGADGQIYNLVDLLGGGMPVSDITYNTNQYSPQGGLVIGEDGKLYSLIELLQNAGGGGGGTVTWSNLIGKPSVFPPEAHNHNEQYYTKQDIDNAGYLLAQPDNETVEIQGGELRARALSGLMHGVTQLNGWLAGTERNIQLQINDILTLISSIGGGLKLKGVLESYADMQQINNMEDGNFVIIIADETRGGGRTWYVYVSDLGTWRYMGDLSPSNKFLALTDTPNGYDDGKILRSSANGLYYDVVRYNEIDGRPDRTKAQIEGAVDKAHGHDNKYNLDKINADASGVLTYNGERYVRASDLSALQAKKRLFAYRSGSDQPLTAGTDCVFNTRHSGDIPYDTNTGIFTLEAGKLYRVEVAGSLYTSGWVNLQLVNAETNSIVNTIARGIWMDVNPSNTNWHESSAGPLKTYFIPSATRGYKIRATSVSGESSLRSNYMSLEVQEI